MVLRPPIESWTRPELEDKFHSLSDSHRDLQKANKELEKKITQLNSRFRKSILDRKSKDDQVVDKDKYDELVRDNELLLLKLKSTKHQLLTYTAPTARSNTLSAMTGRSTVPISGLRKCLPISASRSLRGYSARNDHVSKIADRPYSNNANEYGVGEKANIIKLNRLLREKAAKVAEQQHEIERLNMKLQNTLSDFENYKARSIDPSEAQDSESKEMEIIQLRNERELLARKELDQLRAELELLKQTNDHLVTQLLGQELSGSALDNLAQRKEVAILEEKLREVEKREREIGKRRRQERRQYDEWKQRYRSQMKNMENRQTSIQNASQYENEMDDLTPRSDVSYSDHRRKKKQKMVQDKSDDVLLRLYNDVVGLLETHNGGVNSEELYSDGVLDPKSIEKWQKMYGDLYDELEKVRNMLLLQHNINQKQNVEIAVLKEEYEKLQLNAEERLNASREQLKRKHEEVIILQEKIRAIAYAGQKPITLAGKTFNEGDSLNSELSLKLISLRFQKSFFDNLALNGNAPSAIFLSLEFFDFELQTTPHLQFVENQPMDHTTVYNLVCSNLFMHYLETNGITLEMYRPQSNSYSQMAAAVISLNPLLEKNGQKYESSVHFMDINTGNSIALITYEITLGQTLNKSLSSYKRAECAQNLMSLRSVEELDRLPFDKLVVSIHGCSGVNEIVRTPVELCVVYELLTFSPFFTDTYLCTGSSVEIKSYKEWPIPRRQLKFMKNESITFFLINMADDKKDDGIMGILTIPLLPVLANQAVKGLFRMSKPTLEDTPLALDISVHWRNCLMSDTNNNGTIRDSMPKGLNIYPIPRSTDLKREQTEGNIMKANSNTDVSGRSSESSSPFIGQRKPSVLESPDEELWERPRVVEIVRSPTSSSRSSSITTVEELDKVVHTSNPPPKPHRRASKDSEQPSLPPKLLSESSSNLTSSDDNSDNSNATYTKEQTEGNVVAEESVESDGMPVESERKREQDRNEMKSLLGELPPIAKPRISKLQSDSQSSSLFRSITQENLETSSESEVSPKPEKKPRKSGRNVVFTHPLHHSIPPSETSSLASPTSKREKPTVSLPEEGGRSVIKSVPRPIESNFPFDNTIVGTATLYIDRIYNFEFSPLMHPSYQNSKLYIDWTFLDFPAEECRVSESKVLDHSQKPITIVFNFTKEYKLTQKDIALLEQYIDLQNKLEFCLMTDTGEDSEELAVALLELVSNPTEQIITLALLDVNGIKYANIDLALHYSMERNIPEKA